MTVCKLPTLCALATLCLAAPSALAQGGGCYRLTDASTYQEGCLDPCDCLLSEEFPLTGTFRLQLRSLTQFGMVYDVTDVRLEALAGPPVDPPLRILTGSGTYTRTRPLVGGRMHTLSLELSVNGAPERKFANLPAADPFEFPSVNLEIADEQFICYNIILDIRAEPMCPCEMTCDESIDVFDLLLYLDLWFAMDPRAEFDEEPDVTVFDLLAYLDCWFTRCG